MTYKTPWGYHFLISMKQIPSIVIKCGIPFNWINTFPLVLGVFACWNSNPSVWTASTNYPGESHLKCVLGGTWLPLLQLPRGLQNVVHEVVWISIDILLMLGSYGPWTSAWDTKAWCLLLVVSNALQGRTRGAGKSPMSCWDAWSLSL